MKRGDLFRVYKGSKTDSKKYRIFVIVSREVLINSKFSTVICAPIYTKYDNLSTQVPIDIDEGMKHRSAIHCDELISIQKNKLTNFIGTLSQETIQELDIALKKALGL